MIINAYWCGSNISLKTILWSTSLDIFCNTFVSDNIAEDCLIPGQKKTCSIIRSPGIDNCYFIFCTVCTLGHERFKNICLLSKIGKKMLVKIRMLVCINQSLSLILCVYPTKTLHRYVGQCPLQANSIISFLFLFLLCSSYTHMFRCPWPTMFNHLVQELTGPEPPKTSFYFVLVMDRQIKK